MYLPFSYIRPKAGGGEPPDYPATVNVRDGVTYGAGTGSLVVPGVGDVRLGTDVDAGQGTLAVPAAAQVLDGVAVDDTLGTVVLPTEAQVEDGVTFGPGGALTGELAAGGGGPVGLPTTGQTTEYTTGDDGTYQAGIPADGDLSLRTDDTGWIAAGGYTLAANGRYVHLGNGIYGDLLTGLQWISEYWQLLPAPQAGFPTQRCAYLAPSFYPNTPVGADIAFWDATSGNWYQCVEAHTTEADLATELATHGASYVVLPFLGYESGGGMVVLKANAFADAIAAVEALDFGGFTDWRAANYHEIGSLIDPMLFFEFAPASLSLGLVLTGGETWPGSGTAIGFNGLWSATTYGLDTADALIRAPGAPMSTANNLAKSTAFSTCLPVRGGFHL